MRHAEQGRGRLRRHHSRLAGVRGAIEGRIALLRRRQRRAGAGRRGHRAGVGIAAGRSGPADAVVGERRRRSSRACAAWAWTRDDTPVPIVCLTIGTAENMQRIQQELMHRGIIVAYAGQLFRRGPGRGVAVGGLRHAYSGDDRAAVGDAGGGGVKSRQSLPTSDTRATANIADPGRRDRGRHRSSAPAGRTP